MNTAVVIKRGQHVLLNYSLIVTIHGVKGQEEY